MSSRAPFCIASWSGWCALIRIVWLRPLSATSLPRYRTHTLSSGLTLPPCLSSLIKVLSPCPICSNPRSPILSPPFSSRTHFFSIFLASEHYQASLPPGHTPCLPLSTTLLFLHPSLHDLIPSPSPGPPSIA